MSTENVPLYRTETGGRRHIRECPHLLGKTVVEARDADGEVCTMSARELRGEGRRYFGSLDEALHEFGAARANWPLIGQHLADVVHDQVWIVASGSYIALGRSGRAVAWAGKTYVNPSAEQLIELPDYRPGGGGGPEVHDSWGDTCSVHHVLRSRSGACGMCYD
ncbi:hypothetical protein [Modestobacter sp. VKM Ac-2984]|uniref:hypothetical protein n=1 Tax=Modestobacter sp. VKM Ac-2984 TaxID=3004138 RepID=UPI0022AAA0AC|nr:hypothetical protein [Modestobacter sp. VKM Ac-2984]MCZ2817892.1 hypothetical protein [Modestobacter sp. VKM Ac-2984]